MVDKDGFTVTLEDQKQIEEPTNTNVESIQVPKKRERSPVKVSRSLSPKKGTGELKRSKSPEKSFRKESIRARPGDPKHNWRIISDTVGFTVEEVGGSRLCLKKTALSTYIIV